MASLKQELRTQARKNFVNPYKVGDVLHHSWGWEQTQCDFYQVVAVTKSSVTVRPIKAQTVPGSEGFMSDSRTAVKDAFITEGSHALNSGRSGKDKITPENPTITKRVSFYVQQDGSLKYYIPVPYGWCDKWNGTPQSCTWYG